MIKPVQSIILNVNASVLKHPEMDGFLIKAGTSLIDIDGEINRYLSPIDIKKINNEFIKINS